MPITLALGDITRSQTDAIVNAANSQLSRGGGVCGAIHAAAGPELEHACAQWVREHGQVPTGHAAITPGFALPARWVVHAVGPVWSGGGSDEAALLGRAYRSAVALADAAGAESIAFPSISTGIFGYPVDRAAAVALAAVAHALDEAERVREATFVLFDERTLGAFQAAASGTARGIGEPE